MPTFTKYKTDTVSESGVTLVTCTSGQHFLHSLYVTNTYGSALPFTCEIVHANSTITHIAYNKKILPNDTHDLVAENKIYLLTGDALVVKSPKDGFTVTCSLLEDANF